MRMTPDGAIRVNTAPDSIAVITIDRPAKRNALTPAMFDELSATFEALHDRPGLRACVLTGAGPHFCAGGDITAFAELVAEEDRRAQVARAFRAFRAVESSPVPVICAIDGVAHGGGMELALASDLVIASSRATFALPEVTVGLLPGFGLVRVIPRVGVQRAAMLALTGESITAERALDWGIAVSVVEPDDVLSAASRLAARIAGQPPEAVRAIKSLLGSQARESALGTVTASIVELFASEGHRRVLDTWRAKQRAS